MPRAPRRGVSRSGRTSSSPFANPPAALPTLPSPDVVATVTAPAATGVANLADISAAVSAAFQPLLARVEQLEAGTSVSVASGSASLSAAFAPAIVESSPLTSTVFGVPQTSQRPTVKFWSAIPQSAVDKIVTGQFVEFHTLLASSATSISDAKVLTVGEASEGTLTLTTQPRNSRRVNDIDSWLEAWTVFAAVFSDAHPSRAAELLGYQHQILKANARYLFSAVAAYDRAFRCSAASDPSLRWDAIVQSLYTTSFDARAVRPFRVSSAAASGAAHNMRLQFSAYLQALSRGVRAVRGRGFTSPHRASVEPAFHMPWTRTPLA